VVGALPAGTNNIGDVDVLSIAAGDNNIGNVDVVTINSVAPAFGSGAVGATVMRVALATDSPGVTTLGTATAANSVPVIPASDWGPSATAGYSIFRSLDLDETEEEVKATAGVLYKLRITNNATSKRYVKLYNATTANVTVGTTTPVDTIVVPLAAASDAIVITESYGTHGLYFSTAITIAATTGLADNDTGAPSANDVVVTAFYK
jgi:hypothetical protein